MQVILNLRLWAHSYRDPRYPSSPGEDLFKALIVYSQQHHTHFGVILIIVGSLTQTRIRFAKPVSRETCFRICQPGRSRRIRVPESV